MSARTEAIITRYVLTHVPLGDKSPCKLTRAERRSVAFYMAGETIEDIAACKPYMFVATWRRRIRTWPVVDDSLKEINNFRYGLIARAVIQFVRDELQKVDDSPPPGP